MSRIERKKDAIQEQKDGIKARRDKRNSEKHPRWTRFKEWFMAQPKWKRIAMSVATAVVTILLILLIAAYAFFSSIFGDIFKKTPEDYDLSLKAVDGYYNILLLGVDSRDMDNIEGTRSDAIMVVSISEDTYDVNILSVYRDTFLKMGDKSSYEKITHACMYGGPEMTMKSLNQAMDLDISNYVVVNFNAVADLVDAVGGIEVDVQDYEIQQLNKYTIETAQNIGKKDYKLVEKAGKQTLEGVQAVSYSRIRKGVGDDFKRTERMRTVLTLTMEKMKDMSFSKLTKIIKMMTPQVQTNISKGNILALAVRLPKYNIMGTTGWPYNVKGGTINGASVVIPSDLTSNVIQLHKEFFGQEDYMPSDTVVSISNAIIDKVNSSAVTNITDTVDPEQSNDKPVNDIPNSSTGNDNTSSATGSNNPSDSPSNPSQGDTNNSGGSGSTGSGDNTGQGAGSGEGTGSGEGANNPPAGSGGGEGSGESTGGAGSGSNA